MAKNNENETGEIWQSIYYKLDWQRCLDSWYSDEHWILTDVHQIARNESGGENDYNDLVIKILDREEIVQLNAIFAAILSKPNVPGGIQYFWHWIDFFLTKVRNKPLRQKQQITLKFMNFVIRLQFC